MFAISLPRLRRGFELQVCNSPPSFSSPLLSIVRPLLLHSAQQGPSNTLLFVYLGLLLNLFSGVTGSVHGRESHYYFQFGASERQYFQDYTALTYLMEEVIRNVEFLNCMLITCNVGPTTNPNSLKFFNICVQREKRSTALDFLPPCESARLSTRLRGWWTHRRRLHLPR